MMPKSAKRFSDDIMLQSVSPFHGNGEPLYLLVFAQFRTDGYGEGAELTAHTFPGIAPMHVAQK
jgi:hypothetical protein